MYVFRSVRGTRILGKGEIYEDCLADKSAISLLGILQCEGIQQKITFLLKITSVWMISRAIGC